MQIEAKKPHYKNIKDINKMLFSPEFYLAHKDDEGLIDHIYKDGQ